VLSEFASFKSQLERPLNVKLAEFQRNDRLKHLIFAAQLTPNLLGKLHEMADMIRHMSRTREGNMQLKNLLAHRRAMLYFTQPSTRTFLSFMAACQILGITCNEVRDPKTSSESKRESKLDSIRMFSSYFDVIIMRTLIAEYSEVCAYLMNQLEAQEMRSVPIINAGAGADEHPTQALLDMYTILRTFTADYSRESKQSRFIELQGTYPELIPGPSRKTYLFCGDMGRGRTARSLATVLAQYERVRMFFVSPDHPALTMEKALIQKLRDKGVEVHEFFSLDAVHEGKPLLAQTDCLYMTRIQREHNSEEVEQELSKMDLSAFRLTPERAAVLKSYAPILHPFPRDSVIGEIPTEIDSDPRSMYFRQARNGMWIRAALLVHLFDASEELMRLYAKFKG
jgi:aspartate carbamoyltransferase catalytic subunit